MTIHLLPFDRLTEADLRSLQERRIPEGPTLDYKLALGFDEDGKFELLKDVTAFANAGGGTLVFGVAEGEGEDRGYLAGLPGLAGSPDELLVRVEQILRDNIEERLPGLLLRAVPRDAGGFFLLIRVPGSPLAPHMITMKTTRPRFYLRGTVSSQPMSMRQIKEVALRLESAEARALQWIEARTSRYMQPQSGPRPDVALLHIVPLLADPYLVELTSPEVTASLESLPLMGSSGAYGNWRFAVEGYLKEADGAGHERYGTLVTRSGALEFVDVDLIQPAPRAGERAVWLWEFELGVLEALGAAGRLAAAGLLQLPAMVSLRLLGVEGARVQLPRGISQSFFGHPAPVQVFLPPFVVNDWVEAGDVPARRMFDTLWQAFGFRTSIAYNVDGSRRRYPSQW